MLHYDILGVSNATVSMLLESLRRRHPEGAWVCIVHNLPLEADPPWETAGLEAHTIEHDAWARWRGEATAWLGDGSAERPFRLCGVYKADTKRAVTAFFEDQHHCVLDHYATLTHPSSEVASSATLGSGSVLEPLAVIAPYAQLGRLVNVNRGATIGHHTTVEDFCTINPGVNIAGHCRLGQGVTVGMGANIVDGVTIGADAVIGAGALVTKDVPPGVLAYGVPARIREGSEANGETPASGTDDESPTGTQPR